MGSGFLTATVSFIVPVQEELRAVEAMMRAQADGHHPDLADAMDLLISAGGKRIRPALTILTGKMFGASDHPLISLASAIEILHTATLVHDDLIDGALLRRGKPTLNSRQSPGPTILTGDFLFSCAANLITDTQSVEIMQVFSQTLAIIINGEIVQLLGSRCKADRANYLRRIYSKTASLFETSAKTPAMLAGAGDEMVEAMRQYGREIGIAFQIIDDILDYIGDQGVVGKPLGSDLRQGIVTLPALYYAETQPDTRFARALLEGNCLSNEDITQLVEEIRHSDAIERSHQEAVRYVESGLENLRRVPQTPERYALEALAHYIVERKL
jgi:geranylgeranyl pyrophosphate synthase